MIIPDLDRSVQCASNPLGEVGISNERTSCHLFGLGLWHSDQSLTVWQQSRINVYWRLLRRFYSDLSLSVNGIIVGGSRTSEWHSVDKPLAAQGHRKPSNFQVYPQVHHHLSTMQLQLTGASVWVLLYELYKLFWNHNLLNWCDFVKEVTECTWGWTKAPVLQRLQRPCLSPGALPALPAALPRYHILMTPENIIGHQRTS